ncbi:MAG: hypothetical protein IT287_00415 [Bdellovibrionaceae bacterium]|nr:hypothetical protein [Pseudobdellovibrionaceae bacterium]
MRPNIVLSFLTLFLFCGSALAGNVVKSSGKKVYIVFDKSEGGTFAKDDLFNITDANGKKIGVVELKKVKGLKAIGLLRKGKALKGNGTLFRSVSKKSKMKKLDNSSKTASKLDTDDEYDTPAGVMRWGAQASYGSAKQDVLQDTSTSAQSGSSLGLKAILDYPIFSGFSLHSGFGLEMFSVAGVGTNAQTALTNVDISTKITFVSIDALMKYTLTDTGSMRFHLLGGPGILHPMSKSSDSLDPDTISSLVVGEFGGGIEFKMGNTSIPVDFIYYLFPAGETVKTSLISIKVGMYF